MIHSLIVLTAAERTAVKAYDTDMHQIDPRAIDAVSPGNGVDQLGNTVTLTGKYVVPRAVLDQDFSQYMKDYLSALTYCDLDTDVIFAPQDV